LLQRLHKQYLHCWIVCDPERHHEDEYLNDVFKLRYNFHHEDGEKEDRIAKDGKIAWERWKEIRLTFPDAGLPELVTDFMQEGPKQLN
jgi:hypothetical protein